MAPFVLDSAAARAGLVPGNLANCQRRRLILDSEPETHDGAVRVSTYHDHLAREFDFPPVLVREVVSRDRLGQCTRDNDAPALSADAA